MNSARRGLPSITRRLASVVLAAGLLCALPALSASAAPARPAPAVAGRPGSTAKPDYHTKITLNTQCGYWEGELEWGGAGLPFDKAYIRIEGGELTARCASGWVKLRLHYDTVDNPKDDVVETVDAPGKKKTHFETTDGFNTYKDIYVFLETKLPDGRVIQSKKAGPGA